MVSSASSSSGALSGTPTNVIFSVAHNDESMNAKAPIVAARSAICTTIRAVDHPISPGHRGGGDLQHVEQDGRRYGGEAPAGGEADKGDEMRSVDPPLDPLAEGDGRQK